MNLWQKAKTSFQLVGFLNSLKGGKMKELIKSWAGIMKIVTYLVGAYSLFAGFLPVSTTLGISLVISAAVKTAEIWAGTTKTTDDDAKVADVKKVLEDKKIIK